MRMVGRYDPHPFRARKSMPKTRANAGRRAPPGGRRTPTAGGKTFSSGFAYGAVCGVVVTLVLVYVPGLWTSVDVRPVEPGDDNASVPVLDFEFMYRLPKERVVTNVEPYRPPAGPAAPPVSEDDPSKEYLLQAAAFRGRDDADAMRARLMLATNMGTQVESARDADGGTWHRVLVGPFDSKDEMRRTLATLQEMDVSAVALERPKS